jgi:pseudouridine-5'-phosphate glycosidase
MGYPQNKETALAVETIVRKQGAIPATIAILDGRIKIGIITLVKIFTMQASMIKNSKS